MWPDLPETVPGRYPHFTLMLNPKILPILLSIILRHRGELQPFTLLSINGMLLSDGLLPAPRLCAHLRPHTNHFELGPPLLHNIKKVAPRITITIWTQSAAAFVILHQILPFLRIGRHHVDSTTAGHLPMMLIFVQRTTPSIVLRPLTPKHIPSNEMDFQPGQWDTNSLMPPRQYFTVMVTAIIRGLILRYLLLVTQQKGWMRQSI